MIVTPEKPNPELGNSYIANGSGYDLRSSNLAILDSEVNLSRVDMGKVGA